jgi:hypothetical protein
MGGSTPRAKLGGLGQRGVAVLAGCDRDRRKPQRGHVTAGMPQSQLTRRVLGSASPSVSASRPAGAARLAQRSQLLTLVGSTPPQQRSADSAGAEGQRLSGVVEC